MFRVRVKKNRKIIISQFFFSKYLNIHVLLSRAQTQSPQRLSDVHHSTFASSFGVEPLIHGVTGYVRPAGISEILIVFNLIKTF
jgi:hypothetical protein